MKRLKPLTKTKEQMANHVRRLVKNSDFKVALGVWGNERERIINEGKKKGSSEAWAKLDGFDCAVDGLLKWLEYQPPKSKDPGLEES